MECFFVDTSALVKKYVSELGSPWMQSVSCPTTTSHICIARITIVELIAGVSRRSRGGTLTQGDAQVAISNFRRHIPSHYKILEISETLLVDAADLAQKHGLKGYDAVQLSAMMQLNSLVSLGLYSKLTLISADTELNAAATAEGLLVDNPNLHP